MNNPLVPVPAKVVHSLRVSQVENGCRQDKVWDLTQVEVAEEADLPVVTLDVRVGHGQVVVAPRHQKICYVVLGFLYVYVIK